jgi:3-deoxy-7-phosphoheptulonate synthase
VTTIDRKEYAAISEGLANALDFTRTIGLDSGREAQSYERGGGRGVLGEADLYTRYANLAQRDIIFNALYTSHEGLLLDYEEAMTRRYPVPDSISSSDLGKPAREKYYNTSAHFLWVGDRTRQLDGAHVEYFRGIRNPIGIKVGPSMADDELVALLDSESHTMRCLARIYRVRSRKSPSREREGDPYHPLRGRQSSYLM